jgi:hypothetical protein
MPVAKFGHMTMDREVLKCGNCHHLAELKRPQPEAPVLTLVPEPAAGELAA